MRNILMIKSHSMGVGDLLRSSAAWRALHNKFPNVQLHLLFLTRHAGYPTEALIREHHLLASAHFVTIREGDPGQIQAKRVPMAYIVKKVEEISNQIKPDLIIDFESSGLRTSWVTRKAAKICHARSIGISQFLGRSFFYDQAAPSVRAYKQRHGLQDIFDYTERDFVVLSALGIERNGLSIELQITPDGKNYALSLESGLPEHHRVIGLNIGCGTSDALPRRPPLDSLVHAIHRLVVDQPAVLLLSGASFEKEVNIEFMTLYRNRYGAILKMVNLAGIHHSQV